MFTVLALHVLLVAVLAISVEMACRRGKYRPALCHALWLVVLIKLLIPPVLAWPAPVQNMLPNTPQTFIELTQFQTSVPAPITERTPAPAPVPPVAQSFAFFTNRHLIMPLLATIWLVGCIFVIIRHVLRIRQFRTLLKQARPAPAWLHECAHTLADTFGVRIPSVRVVSGIPGALVWNPWRSIILVSCDLVDTITREDWNGILSHELAHLKRRDLWVGWLELIATCLWWWNPVLYLVRRRLHLYAELACDAWVLWAHPNTGARYAEVLFRIVSSETRRQTPGPAFGMAAGPAAAFKIRLGMLLRGGTACRMSRKAVIAVAVLLMLALPSLTTLAKAAKHITAPITFASSSEPETTRDANGILETRIYLMKGKIKGHDGGGCPPSNSVEAPNQGLSLKMILSKMDPSLRPPHNMPFTMEGETLLWNGKEEPDSPTIVPVASPVFALRPNDAVSVATAIPAQALEWLNAEKALKMKFMCVNTPETNTLWFEVDAEESSDIHFTGKNIVLNVVVSTPLNQWQASVLDLYSRNDEHSAFSHATLLMFCKRKAWDPAQPVQNLPAPTHGEFRIEHDNYQTPDPNKQIQITSEMKLIEGDAAAIENLVAGLAPLTDVQTSPANLRIFRLPPKADIEAQIEKLGHQDPNVQLISAPRVTFTLDGNNSLLPNPLQQGKIVVAKSPEVLSAPKGTLKDTRTEFESFSRSLNDFFINNKPKAVIMSTKAEKRSTHDVATGLALAIATDDTIHDNTLGIHFYSNFRELLPDHRGDLVGKRDSIPEVEETVVTVKMSYYLAEGVCFITKALDPKKLRISFLTLEPIGSKN